MRGLRSLTNSRVNFTYNANRHPALTLESCYGSETGGGGRGENFTGDGTHHWGLESKTHPETDSTFTDGGVWSLTKTVVTLTWKQMRLGTSDLVVGERLRKFKPPF